MPRYRSFAPYTITPREAPVDHGEVVELTAAEAEPYVRCDHLVLLDEPQSQPVPEPVLAVPPVAAPGDADTKETSE
jgi:hypothetical protein